MAVPGQTIEGTGVKGIPQYVLDLIIEGDQSKVVFRIPGAGRFLPLLVKGLKKEQGYTGLIGPLAKQIVKYLLLVFIGGLRTAGTIGGLVDTGPTRFANVHGLADTDTRHVVRHRLVLALGVVHRTSHARCGHCFEGQGLLLRQDTPE